MRDETDETASWTNAFIDKIFKMLLTRRFVLTAAMGLLVGNDNQLHGTRLPLMTLEEAANKNNWEFAIYPDPILRRPSSPVTIFNDELKVSAARLRSAAIKERAMGCAAQQCGVDASLVYLADGEQFLVNPRVVSRSSEPVAWNEFCLVFPKEVDLHVNLLRDASVTVEYEDLTGVTESKTFKGEQARALQHEMDHDRGILIVDHADLSELPAWIARIESDDHSVRQTKAISRKLYCGVQCKERKKLASQSRSDTSRQAVLELSKQRSKLYGTQPRAIECPNNTRIPCL